MKEGEELYDNEADPRINEEVDFFQFRDHPVTFPSVIVISVRNRLETFQVIKKKTLE